MPFFARKARQSEPPGQIPLGPLEADIMEIVWTHGRSSVREVAQHLPRRLAYTTVMTTLDRLFKKGLLNRERSERAFFYVAAQSREQWEQARAGQLVASFLSQQSSGQLLISCLVDAVGKHDEALLDELERQISMKRRELESKGME